MAKISINIKDGSVRKEENDIIVGIDLGTTNSLVAYIDNDNPVTVKDKENKNALVPSIIHFADENTIIVGDEAKTKLITNPENTIYSVKRLMGKSYEDLERASSLLAYSILNEDEDKLVKVKVGTHYYSPIELSAEILKHLKDRIETSLKTTISKCVITVPAYFNDTQRQATRDAGKLAGLDVLRIVNEPTAASLAYGIGLDPDEEKKIAVYDLGGGTFDISILEISHGVFEVLSTNGDTYLGGDDMDKAIIDHWIVNNNITDGMLSQKSFFQELRLYAEKAKKHLTSNDLFQGSINNIGLELDIQTFNSLIEPIVSRTLNSCSKALKDAGLIIDDLDQVLMVGGSTRVRDVKNKVSTFFGKTVNDSLDPDEVVALGAAVQADILSGNRKDILLLDITPLSLGIETVGGLMDTIIPRNTKVPTNQARNYTTSIDGQQNLKVAVYQGERDLIEDNRKLGEFILQGIPPMAAGIPKILIQFTLDADGILTVKAKEERSNVETQIEIRSQYGISEEEMALMLLDSIKNASDDMGKRALIEAQTEAKNIVHSSNKFLSQNKGILTENEMDKINELTQKLNDQIENGDKNSIQLAMDEMNEYTSPLAEKALDHNIAEALKGKDLTT